MSDAQTPVSTKRRRRIRFRRWVKVLGIFLLLAFIGVNAIAFMQARALTHFVATSERTAPPEKLSFGEKCRVLICGVRIPRPQNTMTPADVSLEFQTFRFGGASGSDCEAWFVPCANARGICIGCPPYRTSKESLLGAAQEFHRMGFDVLLVDYRGVGGSVGDRTTLGYEEAEDVAAASRFARERWPGDQQILYGPSMGGVAILRAVADLDVHPAGIIMESTFDRLLSTVEDRFYAMHLPAFPCAELLVFWGGVELGYNGFAHDPVGYASRVRCPVLMMQGSRDARVTDEQARNLYDHLAGPRQIEIFADCGHCEFFARHNARWKELVLTFLRQSVQ